MTARLGATAIRKLANEITKLQTAPPEGIQVTVNENTLSEIHATIDGPIHTPYEGGKFRVRLTIDETFPDTPPKGHFLTKIFHPNVSEQGEICVNTLKKDWQRHYGIEHVLVTVKCLLIYPNPESALNEEAGKLLLEHYEDYAKHARLITQIHAKPKVLPTSDNRDIENQDPQQMAAGAKRQQQPSSTAMKDRKKKNLRRF